MGHSQEQQQQKSLLAQGQYIKEFTGALLIYF